MRVRDSAAYLARNGAPASEITLAIEAGYQDFARDQMDETERGSGRPGCHAKGSGPEARISRFRRPAHT